MDQKITKELDSRLLAALIKAQQEGIDPNRLLFIRYLVLRGHISDDLQPAPQKTAVR